MFVVEETGDFEGSYPQKEEFDPYDVDRKDSYIKYQNRVLYHSEWQNDELSSSVSSNGISQPTIALFLTQLMVPKQAKW